MMQRILLTCFFIFKIGLCLAAHTPNIAIIGGGIGGASTSHFLTELFQNNLKIDLYEAKNIGGRLATVEIDKHEYEAGGSVIHSRNRYMQEFVKLLGMESGTLSNHRYAIWNGIKMVFQESTSEIWTLAKLIYNYGVQPFKLNRYIDSILNDFENIYDLQNSGKFFTNVTSLLMAINNEFPKLLQVSIKDHLLNLGYAEKLINELVETTLVVNYGQDTRVHTFVGCVSLAGAGATLWVVKGGNKQIPEHLIYRNKNITVVPSYVKNIRYVTSNGSSPSYEIYYTNKESTDIIKCQYDLVIIATPLTHDQEMPSFEGFPKDFKFVGEYHTTVATFVKGDLNPHYFGLSEELDGILSCNPNCTKINSIGILDTVEGPIPHDSKVWKIFSKEPLKERTLKRIFQRVEETKEIIWKAYPRYSTELRFDEFKLYEGLYHVNAIEWAASAMEMSAIAGRNVALLAYNEFLKKSMPASNIVSSTETSKNTYSPEL